MMIMSIARIWIEQVDTSKIKILKMCSTIRPNWTE